MKWFKFYGQDFLTDPRIFEMDPLMKLLWVVLLCLADSETGKIKHLTEYSLLRLAGTDDNSINDPSDYERTTGALTYFERLGMITIDNENDNDQTVTIKNFTKRQDLGPMTDYERVKKYREKKKAENNNKIGTNDNNDNEMITPIRREEKRIYNTERIKTSDEVFEDLHPDVKKRLAQEKAKTLL